MWERNEGNGKRQICSCVVLVNCKCRLDSDRAPVAWSASTADCGCGIYANLPDRGSSNPVLREVSDMLYGDFSVQLVRRAVFRSARCQERKTRRPKRPRAFAHQPRERGRGVDHLTEIASREVFERDRGATAVSRERFPPQSGRRLADWEGGFARSDSRDGTRTSPVFCARHIRGAEPSYCARDGELCPSSITYLPGATTINPKNSYEYARSKVTP